MREINFPHFKENENILFLNFICKTFNRKCFFKLLSKKALKAQFFFRISFTCTLHFY